MDHLSRLVFYAVICCSAGLVFDYVRRRHALPKIPRIGISPGSFNFKLREAKAEFLQNGRQIVDEGYARFKDSMFLVQTSDLPRIVLSIKYLEELRAVPESKLSHREGVCDRFLGSYTGLDVVRHSHLHNDVCQIQLVQNLGAMLPAMFEEANLAFSDNLASDASSFVPFQSYSTIFNIIARINSRVLVGAPTCRDKEWLEVSEGYPQDVIHVASDLRPYNVLLRPLVYPFLASATRLRRYFSIAEKQLTPLVTERMLSAEKDKPRDVLQWMISLARGEDAKPANLIGKMLFLTMATFHASTATAVHAVYDLCTMPEYFEPLRKEIREELETEGGTWNLAVLHRLKRLDSFLKESQRMNAPGLRE